MGRDGEDSVEWSDVTEAEAGFDGRRLACPPAETDPELEAAGIPLEPKCTSCGLSVTGSLAGLPRGGVACPASLGGGGGGASESSIGSRLLDSTASSCRTGSGCAGRSLSGVFTPFLIPKPTIPALSSSLTRTSEEDSMTAGRVGDVRISSGGPLASLDGLLSGSTWPFMIPKPTFSIGRP